jgi:1-acyl-sn-glycerol-3-phosphate acyltransferase
MWLSDARRFLRGLGRVFSLAGTTFAHTLYLALKVRRLPPEAQALYRARRQQVGCAILCRILGVRVRVRGTLPEGGRMLAVCNHFGVLDPLVLASVTPVSFVGKAEMRDWPFIGWVTKTMGVVFVERERRMQTAAFVDEMQDKLRKGVRVLVFPEGTTGPTEAVMPFKTGAFAAVVGLEAGAVLPLYLKVLRVEGAPAVGPVRDRVVWSNSPQSFVQHGWQLLTLRGVEMEVRVGQPIPVGEHDRKGLAERAHEQVHALGEPHGEMAERS